MDQASPPNILTCKNNKNMTFIYRTGSNMLLAGSDVIVLEGRRTQGSDVRVSGSSKLELLKAETNQMKLPVCEPMTGNSLQKSVLIGPSTR